MAVREWLERFRDEVVTIDGRVSRELGVTRPLLEHPRQPVHFRDVDGYEAVGGLWSTRDRIARAMNLPRERLIDEIGGAQRTPEDFRIVDRADFFANESTDFDLRDSPVPKLYPKDAGRYITAGVWVAEWEGKRNLSFHRILLLDATRGAARIVPRHLLSMHRQAQAAGQELKVAVCVGLDPWLLIGGGTSVEYGVDETRIASALKRRTLGAPVDCVRLKSGLAVPADAEYVLEGRLTGETHAEGPFVDAVLTYDRVRQEPVVEFERVYHRQSPIFHIIVGGSDEHFNFMGMPREPIIRDGVAKVVPRVAGVRLTEGGCAWLHAVVAIEKHTEGDGKNAIMAAFAAHTSLKQVTVVDADVNLWDDREVEWAVATRFQADRGLVVLHGVRGSSIDPSAGETTSKMGIDATRPINAKPEMFLKATP
ncbi:MAG: UbiD family decarboxylase [Methanobacteriota archaeon]|nr:MAG: UbiD family decarboxylase [Euryarchaeota archaeon]